MKNKKQETTQKHKTYITYVLEIIVFLIALILITKVNIGQDYSLFIPAVIVFLVGAVITSADLIYHKVIKYYTFDIVGKSYVYKKMKCSEEKTIKKYKEYYTYYIDKKNISEIKDYKLFKVVYGKINKRRMWAREVKDSTYVDKIIIPYYISNGKI